MARLDTRRLLGGAFHTGHSRGRSESVPCIHEKWRRTPEICVLAPGNGDLERARKVDEVVKLRLRRLRLGIRGLQMVCSLVVVALLGQSLIMFMATQQSLIDPTTKVWPTGVEVWPTVIVLIFNVAIMIFAFAMVVGYFWKYPIVKKLANLYTTLLLISTILTIGIYTINAILLKSRPISSLPLSTVSCLLAETTHRFDHRTICQSHIWSFNCTLFGIFLDILLLMSILFMYRRRQTQSALYNSRQSLATRLREFDFSVRNSIRMPSPTYRKPMLYPGRVWRLEWGEMEEIPENEMEYGQTQRKVSYSVIGPGSAAVQSPSYRTYF